MLTEPRWPRWVQRLVGPSRLSAETLLLLSEIMSVMAILLMVLALVMSIWTKEIAGWLWAKPPAAPAAASCPQTSPQPPKQ